MATTAGEVKVTGANTLDAVKRLNVINKIQNQTTTEQLEKLEKMLTPKGLKALDDKWFLIKKFV